MGSVHKKHPVNVGVSQGFVFSPTLSLLYIGDLPDDVVLDIATEADDSTRYSKYDRASYVWQ